MTATIQRTIGSPADLLWSRAKEITYPLTFETGYERSLDGLIKKGTELC
jgi:hypothetical protein